MLSIVITSAICASTLVYAARIKRAGVDSDEVAFVEAGLDEVAFVEKEGSGDDSNIYIAYNQTYSELTGQYGNSVGTVQVQVQGTFTNQGWIQGYPPQQWQNGMCLGKSDEYIWAIPTAQHGMAAFTFDHGVSDLVFGDLQGSGMFRPEFDEIIYQSPNMGAGTPDAALRKQLAEENKEKTLKFGTWYPDGYFQGGHGQAASYTPRLKVKDGSTFQNIGRLGSQFQSAMLQRPSILDIDNLFSTKPLVPSFFRPSQAVQSDMTYQSMGGNTGYNQGGYNQGGYHQPGYNQGGNMGYNQGGNMGYNGGMPQHGHGGMPMGGQCYPQNSGGKTCKGQCMTSQQCSQARGKFKAKYCAGRGCGCCKIKGRSYLQTNETEVALTNDVATTANVPVQIGVQWLTPVLQKYQCVSVAPQYAKTGAQSLFIAMGWDTESGISGLDLDLSLVAIGKTKKMVPGKTVYYQEKSPSALSCPGSRFFGMQAFLDDRSGDQPGDDELVKVNLGCLSQYHPDVEAVVVVVSVYQPAELKWNQIDSAYLRIISGGQELASGGNFFVKDAEAVRSFVRLSGNDLKEDPELKTNSIAVGMFFRQQSGWAFATLMKGIPGRNVIQAGPHLERLLQDLVYPANEQWDKTQEQAMLHQQGQFGKAGIHAKATTASLIGSGQLPCVASRTDQARMHMAHMTPQDLQNVQNSHNPNIPPDVKKFAGQMQNPQVANKMQGMAQASDKMSKVNTEAERKQIANNIGNTPVVPPTQQESSQASVDLDSLFDAI